MRAALIIPALNEAPVIAQTLARVPTDLYAAILVADNGSTDGTGPIAQRHGATVVREDERGYGAACLKALAHLPPGIDAVVFMQADLSENPDEARRLLAPIQEGCADMVLGSRTVGRAEPGALLPHQAVGNLAATTLIRLLYRFRYTDLGPFRAIRLDALRGLHMRERAYGWTVEMQVRAVEQRLRIIETPISYGVRAAGENKVSGNAVASIRAGARIIWTIVRLWLRSASR